jgi:hypothetical protein
LAGNLVQSLLSGTGDLASALSALLSDLELVKGDHGVSDDTSGGITMNLGLRSSSVSTSESLLKSSNTGSLSQVDLSGDAG